MTIERLLDRRVRDALNMKAYDLEHLQPGKFETENAPHAHRHSFESLYKKPVDRAYLLTYILRGLASWRMCTECGKVQLQTEAGWIDLHPDSEWRQRQEAERWNQEVK